MARRELLDKSGRPKERAERQMKRVLLVLCGVLPVAVMFCLIGCSNGTAETKGGDLDEQRVVELYMDLDDLAKVYKHQRNAIAAAEIWRNSHEGKYVMLRGYVTEVDTDSNGDPFLILQGSVYDDWYALFLFGKDLIPRLMSARIGNSEYVKGELVRREGNVFVLTDCSFKGE